jgi:hypothetical protein
LAILAKEHPPFLQISNLFLGGFETFGKVPLPKSRPRFAKGTLAILVQETLPFLLIANLFLGGCETFGKVAFAKEPPPKSRPTPLAMHLCQRNPILPLHHSKTKKRTVFTIRFVASEGIEPSS